MICPETLEPCTRGCRNICVIEEETEERRQLENEEERPEDDETS